jgi:hypothetical protein
VDWVAPVCAWTPDGELWFVDDTKRSAIHRYRPESGKPSTLIAGSESDSMYLRDVHAAADGRTVAYLATAPKSNSTLITIDVATERSRVLATLGLGTTSVLLRGWMNGSWIVVHRTKINDDFTGEFDVLAIDAISGAQRRIATVTSGFSSTAQLDASRQALVVTRAQNGVHNIYDVSLRTGTVRQVTRNTLPGVTYSGFQPIAGGGLIGAREERRQDIWLIQPAAASRTGNPAGR